MVAARTSRSSLYKTSADESVIDAPKPWTAWYRSVGSTTTVTAELSALPSPKTVGACSAMRCRPSGVVTQLLTNDGLMETSWSPDSETSPSKASGTSTAAVQ